MTCLIRSWVREEAKEKKLYEGPQKRGGGEEYSRFVYLNLTEMIKKGSKYAQVNNLKIRERL
jgi:hypothetical protein